MLKEITKMHLTESQIVYIGDPVYYFDDEDFEKLITLVDIKTVNGVLPEPIFVPMHNVWVWIKKLDGIDKGIFNGIYIDSGYFGVITYPKNATVKDTARFSEIAKSLIFSSSYFTIYCSGNQFQFGKLGTYMFSEENNSYKPIRNYSPAMLQEESEDDPDYYDDDDEDEDE